MNLKWYISLIVCIMLAAFGLTACGDDNNETTGVDESLFVKISKDGNLSIFKEILVRSGYDKMLNATGSMTVLAPNNESLKSQVNNLSDSLCSVWAKRHIFVSAFIVTSNGGKEIKNLLGETLTINAENGLYKSSISSDNDSCVQTELATIVATNIACSNGNLNILGNISIENDYDNVIFEPEIEPKTDTTYHTFGVLDACNRFVREQIQLETVRINNEYPLTPSTELVRWTMSDGYMVINNANYALVHISNLSSQEVASARFYRAFIYYNMAMLWGNIYFYTKPLTSLSDVEEVERTTPSSQTDVYNFAYDEITEALNDLPVFSHDAGLMLKAEIELTLGLFEEAYKTLQLISDKNIHFALVSENPEVRTQVVYTPTHLALFTKEAKGETEQLHTEWANNDETRYGYWAALKRLGKAKEVAGCSDSELLMPMP